MQTVELLDSQKYINDAILNEDIRSLLNCVPYVLTCLACLRVNVSCVLTCQRALRAYVPTCFACSRISVSCVLTYHSALHAYVLTCQRALRA